MDESKPVKIRTPGLWMADCGPGRCLDAFQVEKARLHLIDLLRDPYYLEAAIRLKRSGKFNELIDDPGGNPEFGSIAHKLQHPQKSKPKHDGPGRPKKLQGLGKLLEVIDHSPVGKSKSLIGWCRAIVRDTWPNDDDGQSEGRAKVIHRKLLDIRRGLREGK